MRDALRHFVAEFIGIFALVFVGSGAIIDGATHQRRNSAHPRGQRARTDPRRDGDGDDAHLRSSEPRRHDRIPRRSAHRAADGGHYICAQILGAIAAAYTLKACMPAELFAAARGGGQSIALDVTATQGFVLEMVATFFLTFVVFGTAVDPNAPKVGGFAIGLTLGASILAIGPLTGGSLNPARSLGPAVASGVFEGQVVYWAGPIVGAIVAALIYDQLFLRRAPELPLHGAVRPEEPPSESPPPKARKKH